MQFYLSFFDTFHKKHFFRQNGPMARKCFYGARNFIHSFLNLIFDPDAP